jgi:RNA polymerase sigma-70 factor (ECF subfamily)
MSPAAPVPPATDAALVARLRAGDAGAYRALRDAFEPSMLRVAADLVPSPAVAEEVVQDTWAAVLDGIAGFAGRCSLRTWIFRILRNRAIDSARRERRSIPLSALSGREQAPLDLDDLAGEGGDPLQHVLDAELRTLIAGAIGGLPRTWGTVVGLRDVVGWDAQELRAHLDVSEGNQRVILHRARKRVRAVLRPYL